MNNRQKAATGISVGAILVLAFHLLHAAHVVFGSSETIKMTEKPLILKPIVDSVSGQTSYDTIYPGDQ